MRKSQTARTLSTAMFAHLREEILTGKLSPGQKLKVSQLSEQHEVSLNVVREALNRLAGEGLVQIEPQHGFAVQSLSADDLIDLTHQRIIFEGIALRQSIARGDVEWQSKVVAAHHRLCHTPVVAADSPSRLNPDWLARHEEFNYAMLEACGSPRLLQMVDRLIEAGALYQRALLPMVHRDGELDSEHTEMLQAILAGDADTAVAVLANHLLRTRDVMLPLLQHAPQAEEMAAE